MRNGALHARARGDHSIGCGLRRAERPARAGAAAADDVADFFLAELLFADSVGATMELGRSARSVASRCGCWCRRRSSQRGTGSSTNDRKFCSTVSEGACSRSRSAAAAGVPNDQRYLAELAIMVPLRARARGDPQRLWTELRRAERPARAGAAAADRRRRFLFSGIVVRGSVRGDDGARAIGADAVGFTWSGGCDGAGAGRASRYRVIDK